MPLGAPYLRATPRGSPLKRLKRRETAEESGAAKAHALLFKRLEEPRLLILAPHQQPGEGLAGRIDPRRWRKNVPTRNVYENKGMDD